MHCPVYWQCGSLRHWYASVLHSRENRIHQTFGYCHLPNVQYSLPSLLRQEIKFKAKYLWGLFYFLSAFKLNYSKYTSFFPPSRGGIEGGCNSPAAFRLRPVLCLSGS